MILDIALHMKMKNQVLSQLPPLRLYNTFIQMKVTIMQPAYLPWLGYFDRIEMSDIMIYLDDVFLDTNSKTNFINSFYNIYSSKNMD